MYRLLLLLAFVPAAFEADALRHLPRLAAANGAGSGAPWPSAVAATWLAAILAVGGATLAWVVARRHPRLAGLFPGVAVLAAVACRRLAVSGAPDEFYLVDDRKLWLLLLGVALLLLVAIPPLAPVPQRPGVQQADV